jgi:hypothetical protein
MFLDYFALFMTLFVAVFMFYAIIAIHDIPYEIAKKRKHPHQDAIHVAGWISLFTLHVIWPFLWIWSTLYREDRGWGFDTTSTAGADTTGVGTASDAGDLEKRVDELASKVESLQDALDEQRLDEINRKAED